MIMFPLSQHHSDLEAAPDSIRHLSFACQQFYDVSRVIHNAPYIVIRHDISFYLHESDIPHHPFSYSRVLKVMPEWCGSVGVSFKSRSMIITKFPISF